jgi:phage-related protein
MRKTLHWMGDSKRKLRAFPVEVRSEIGQALYQAELGEGHRAASTMKGINAVEIVVDDRGDTYRGVYTTKIKNAIVPPKPDMDLIRARLAASTRMFKE